MSLSRLVFIFPHHSLTLHTIQLQLRVPLLAIIQESPKYRTEHVLIECPIKWCQTTMSLESSSAGGGVGMKVRERVKIEGWREREREYKRA